MPAGPDRLLYQELTRWAKTLRDGAATSVREAIAARAARRRRPVKSPRSVSAARRARGAASFPNAAAKERTQ